MASHNDTQNRKVVKYMWYIYVLRSLTDKKLYIGSTNDIHRRLEEHNCGKVDSTKSRMPLKLESYFAVHEKSKAIEIEQYFKTGSGKALLNKRFL